jgi:mRNA-degrading endonuclease toxin of MazEF toxin-antitoxin module
VSARRGEVWLIDCGNPGNDGEAGRHPAVVVSADALGESPAGVILVVPTTASHRGLPSHVAIEPGASGLESVRYARCEDLQSIPEERLLLRLGIISGDALAATARVLAFLLDL